MDVAIVKEEGVKNGGKLVYATPNRGLNVSRNNGETFAFQELDSPWQYTRTIKPRADGEGRCS